MSVESLRKVALPISGIWREYTVALRTCEVNMHTIFGSMRAPPDMQVELLI